MQSNDFKTLLPCINALRKKIEKKQQYTGFTPFNDGFYVKKKLQYKYRLIASSEQISEKAIDGEEHEILVFHDLMIRKDPNYNNPNDSHCFCRDPEGFAQQHNYRPTDHSERCIDYCRKRLNEQNVPKPKKTPSDYENEILYGTFHGTKSENDISIYEMKEWKKSLNDKTNVTLLTTFLHVLYGTVNDALAKAVLNEKTEWNIQPVEFGTGHKRYYSYYYNSNERIFILGEIVASDNDAFNFIAKYEPIFDSFDKNKVLKFITRAYPESVLQNPADHTLWENIETEKTNNMALSPEELDILNSVLDSGSRKYPLFINGRAGSGKSTILQYLFTSYYFHYLCSKDEKDASPIYFTYSDKLLTTAKETVDKLLGNHEYLGSIKDDAKKDFIEDKRKRSRDKSFRNFSDFLLEVARKKRTTTFLPQNKIDFQKFKALWQKKFKNDQEIMRKTTPEICWHVIRTYIKGDSVETLMDVQEYESSPSHSIPKELFKLIYDKIWLPWYSEITLFTDKGDQEFEAKPKSQYWDDQDLVRFVLNEDEESESGSLLNKYFEEEGNGRFCAIFCDESQDFTHIELEAILEMSLFLYRKVNQIYINKIPFIFAGDPFQTLNPTGFSWEATKKGFVDKIARVLEKKKDSVDLNYKELKMNYRSDSDIVKFSNAVQVIRAAKLNPEKLRIEPQLPWNEEAGSCQFFDWKDAEFWNWLKKNGDVSFVLPCESSSRGQFIDDSPILREHLCRSDHVPGKEGGYKYPVFSAQDIKGLEYDKVVVFGFGAFDKSANDGGNSKFANLIENGIGENDSHLLEMEYFINRLYVAVTRPKKHLMILDDSKGTFWDKLKVDQKSGEEQKILWLEKIIPQNCRDSWNEEGNAIEKFALPVMGRSSSLSGETSGEDREKFAEKLLQEGIDNRDEERLDIALQRFIEIKGENTQKCAEIKGYIAYVKEKPDYEDAARKFYEAGKKISANHCWFLTLKTQPNVALPEISRLADESLDCRDSLQFKLSSHIKSNNSPEFFISILNECAEFKKDYAKNLKNDIFSWDKDFESWQWCFNEILSGLTKAELSTDQAQKISEAIDKQNLFELNESALIDFYFKTKLYDKLPEFESLELSTEDRKKVNLAKAYKEGFPKSLYVFNDVKDYATICDIYMQEYSTRKDKIVDTMEQSTIKIVFDANKQKKNLINNSALTCLFAQYIDLDTWNAYYNSQKKNSSYKLDCVNLLCKFGTKRNDNSFAKDIVDKLKKNTMANTEEAFNLFYICCLGITNEHPIGIDLMACMSSLRRTFDDVEAIVKRFSLSFGDLVQFGRLFEYISAQSNDEDKPRYWKNTDEFYSKVLKQSSLKSDQKTSISKRIVFAKDQISDAYEKLSRKRGLRRNVIEDYLRNYDIYRQESRNFRIEKSISVDEKIEALSNTKDVNFQTMKMASIAWKNDGFIIKHQTEVAKTSDNPSPYSDDSNVVSEKTKEDTQAPTTTTEVKTLDTPETDIPKGTTIIEEVPDNSGADSLIVQNGEYTSIEEPHSEKQDPSSEKKSETENATAAISNEPERPEDSTNAVKEEPAIGPPLLYPKSLVLEIGGYKIEGNQEDDDYNISIFVANDPRKLLGSINSYGSSPIRQKGLIVDDNGFSYGDFPKIEIKSVNDCYVISIGSFSIKIKKA